LLQRQGVSRRHLHSAAHPQHTRGRCVRAVPAAQLLARRPRLRLPLPPRAVLAGHLGTLLAALADASDTRSPWRQMMHLPRRRDRSRLL